MKIAMVLCRTLDELKHDSRVLRESHALVDAGHKVTIYIAHPGKMLENFVLDYGVQVFSIPIQNIIGFSDRNIFKKNKTPLVKGYYPKTLQYIANRLYRRRYIRETLNALLTQETDAIHCHDFHTLAIGVHAKNVLGTMLTYDSHEIFTETMAFSSTLGWLKRPVYIWRERQLIRKVDKVITVGQGCAHFLAQRYKIPLPVVVENISEFTPEKNLYRDDLRKSMGVRKSQKLLMYQGLLAPGRGIETLLEALCQLPTQYVLALVGYGPSETLLQHKVDSLGIGERVKFVGRVPREELLSYVQCADAGVIPIQKRCLNYYYALPNKIFECMAAGVPIAVSNFPDMSFFALDEGMGTVFDPESPESIAQAIQSLFADQGKFQLMQRRVVNKSVEKYNWTTVQEKLVEIYA